MNDDLGARKATYIRYKSKMTLVLRQLLRICYMTVAAMAPVYGIPLHLFGADGKQPVERDSNRAPDTMPPPSGSPPTGAPLSSPERQAWEEIVANLREAG